MKDAKVFEKKIKKLLAGMKKAEGAHREDNPFRLLAWAALEENASKAQASRAMAAFDKEFVSVNELRVAQPGELVEMLGKNYPRPRETAKQIIGGLNEVFYDANGLSMAHLAGMAKRDLRQKLSALKLSPYVAASLVLFAFEGHAIPVDDDLADTLAMDGYVAEGSSVKDVQGFLERVIAQKNAAVAHQHLRSYVARRAEVLAKKRKADRQARLAAERKAAEAEAKAAAEKEAAAKAKAEAQAKANAAKKPKRKAASAKERADKKTAEKTAGKTTKKIAKKKSAPGKASAKEAKKKPAEKSRK